MGLYLCIFEDDEDIDGVEVGPYADFNGFRDFVVRELEGGREGSQFPVLILHSDCDGEWPVAECRKLQDELSAIASAMKKLPAVPFVSEWQKAVAKAIGLVPASALESFVDVDGEFLVGRLQALVGKALERGLPIVFQ
jgi:hypothetical protein